MTLAGEKNNKKQTTNFEMHALKEEYIYQCDSIHIQRS